MTKFNHKYVKVCHKCSNVQQRENNNGSHCTTDGKSCAQWLNCRHIGSQPCDHRPPAQFEMEVKMPVLEGTAVTPTTEVDKSWAATPKKGVDGMSTVNSYDVLVYEELNDGQGNITRNNLVNTTGVLAETAEAAIAAACLVADVKLTSRAIVKVKIRGF